MSSHPKHEKRAKIGKKTLFFAIFVKRCSIHRIIRKCDGFVAYGFIAFPGYAMKSLFSQNLPAGRQECFTLFTQNSQFI